MIAMQSHFGLTRLEAAKFFPMESNREEMACLVIHDKIAHNYRKRIVPMHHDYQREALSIRYHLVTTHLLYCQKEPQIKSMPNLYDAECLNAGIAINTPFRCIYAEKRLSELINSLESEAAAWKQLANEMGYSRANKLKDRLYGQKTVTEV
tara:strand:+ start:65 stop:517 length:453 start_codon:yes stop_codon:yes gene_type:complete